MGERGAAPRASLGRPFRSPPSPEARQKRGGNSVDSGEWSVVRRRRRKTFRQEDRGQDRMRQSRGYQSRSRSYSRPGYSSFYDRYAGNSNTGRDHRRFVRSQSRYSEERFQPRRQGCRSAARRSGSHQYRSCSAARSRSAARYHKPVQNLSRRSCSVLRYHTSRHFHSRRQSYGERLEGRDDRRSTQNLARRRQVMERLDLDCFKKQQQDVFSKQQDEFESTKQQGVLGSNKQQGFGLKRNKYGEPYGFVKFSNVKDVTKMTNALNAEKVGPVKGVDGSLQQDGRQNPTRCVETKGVVENNKKMGTTLKRGGDSAPNSGKVGPGTQEGVRVGDIVVKLGARQERPDHVKGVGCLLESYRTESADVKWVHNGVVATVINGEAIPVVQNRLTDAGFTNLALIPMGADKVFVRCSEGVDAMSIVNNAKEFFHLVFSNWTRWGMNALPYQMGAWVRLFLRADSCSADKDRLDFARVLIATSDLDIIKKVETVLVDGIMVEIKIVEEWGYAMGEDTCLFENESWSEGSQSDYEEGFVDPEVRRNVDMGESDDEVERFADTLGLDRNGGNASNPQGETGEPVHRTVIASQLVDTQDRSTVLEISEETRR
ncbi:DUF4283 domain protein, partial [Trifolium medium]|nr:DUF4283 domain protein [Trifolium medium]